MGLGGKGRETMIDQYAKVVSHVLRSEFDTIAVSGQHPFEPIVEQPFKGQHHCTRSPDQPPGRLERSGFRLPPEMVAGEQKPLVVEQRTTAGCVSGHRDEIKLRSQRNDV